MTIIEAVLEIFRREQRPLSAEEVFELIVESKLYLFNSENPKHVVSTAIRRYTKGLNFESYKKFYSKTNYFEEIEGLGEIKYQYINKDYNNLNNLSIVELNQKFYSFLHKIRAETRHKLYYVYRKGNYGGWLDLGYWFYGDDNSLLISFWNGMDWKNKAPNIRIKFTIDGNVTFEVSMTDSDAKQEFLKNELINVFQMNEENNIYYHVLGMNCNLDEMLDILYRFIRREKEDIDSLIKEYNYRLERLSENTSNNITFIDYNDFNSRERKVRYYQGKLNDDISERKLSFKKPSKIKSFKVKNYGPIKSVSVEDISSDNQWFFITGENGSGKTNLLKALAITLGYKTLNRDELNQRFFVEMELFSYDSLEPTVKLFKREANNNDTSYRRPKVMGLCMYGPYRLINSKKLSKNKFKALFQKAGTFHSLFSDASPLLDLEQQLDLWKSNKDQYIEKRLYFLRIILINIVPGLFDIRLDKNKPVKYIIRKDNEEKEIEVKWEELSSGTKSVFSLVVDIMLRLYEQQPKIIDPAELKGIVMIDEIDLHLHPKAQKELILTLSNVFQNIQFIVTTHSPIPLLGAPKNSQIYVMKNINNETTLERMDKKVIFSRLAPNALLSSPIFNFDKLIPESKHKDDLPYFDETFNEVQYMESLDRNIHDFYNNERKKELLNIFLEEN